MVTSKPATCALKPAAKTRAAASGSLAMLALPEAWRGRDPNGDETWMGHHEFEWQKYDKQI